MSTDLDKQPIDELLGEVEQDIDAIETIHPDVLRFKVLFLKYLLNKTSRNLAALYQAGLDIPVDETCIHQLHTLMADVYILEHDVHHLQAQLLDTTYTSKKPELILSTLINYWQRNPHCKVGIKHKVHMRDYYAIVSITTQIQQDARRLLEQGKTLDGCSASTIAQTLNHGAMSFGAALHKDTLDITGLITARHQAELGLEYASFKTVPTLKAKILTLIDFIDSLVPVKQTMLTLFPSLVSAQASMHIEKSITTANKTLTNRKSHRRPINPLIL